MNAPGSMLVPETVETERLLLRQFTGDDFEPFAAMSADEEVMRFIGGGGPVPRESAWTAIAMYLGHWALLGYGQWAVEEKATGVFLGRIGLWNPVGWPGLEVGWVLARAAWGKGYATEGATVALAHAFDTLGAEHVISLIRADNARSIRVAEKLGETLEGEIEFRGAPVLVYGIHC